MEKAKQVKLLKFTFQVDGELADALEAECDRQMRTKAQMLKFVLRKYLFGDVEEGLMLRKAGSGKRAKVYLPDNPLPVERDGAGDQVRARA